MQKIATAAEMQAADRHAIETIGIPGLVLMENAGGAVARLLLRRFSGLEGKKVTVVCGKGNNGGDGFVVARHLAQSGVGVRILLLAKRAQLKSDARINADIAHRLDLPIIEVTDRMPPAAVHALKHCQIIVDAIFGTGLGKPAIGLYKRVIQKINASGKWVLSIDLPSGVDSDSGALIGDAVRADLTAALALHKRSHVLYPAAETMGEVVRLDIGIPEASIGAQNIGLNLTEESDIRTWLPRRRKNTHKGHYGHVLVVGGSRGKAGAAGLSALAALRSGAGLASLAVPESCQPGLEFQPLETMSVALPETPGGALKPEALSRILEHLKGKQALALGPGLGTQTPTMALVRDLLPHIPCPAVIDADGINILARIPDWRASLRAEVVLTPHPKEFARLTGISVPEIMSRRLDLAAQFARQHKTALVLKGAHSIMAFPDGELFVNPTGNPGMATAGSGDVLTGIIAGLLAQGLEMKPAVVAGVYLHGLAGDIYAGGASESSLLAGDLLRVLPQTLRDLLH